MINNKISNSDKKNYYHKLNISKNDNLFLILYEYLVIIINTLLIIKTMRLTTLCMSHFYHSNDNRQGSWIYRLIYFTKIMHDTHSRHHLFVRATFLE